MIRQWEHSANVLIMHFRYIVAGSPPFHYNWERGSDVVQDAGLDESARLYMERLVELLQSESVSAFHQTVPGLTALPGIEIPIIC